MYYNIGPYGGVSMKFNIKKLNFGLPQKYDQEQENIIYQSQSIEKEIYFDIFDEYGKFFDDKNEYSIVLSNTTIFSVFIK